MQIAIYFKRINTTMLRLMAASLAVDVKVAQYYELYSSPPATSAFAVE